MTTINGIGAEFILFLQSIGEWLVLPMGFFTFLGVEWFYLFIAPILYWCIHPGLGLRVGLLLLFSSSLNSVLKLVFHTPRPYWIDSRITAYFPDTSFGIPSGHAQNAVVVWGGIALWVKRSWFWILAIILIFLIGFSRIWLGVHFPQDTLMGWLIGLLILFSYSHFEKPVVTWLRSVSPWGKIGLGFVISLSMIMIGALIVLLLSDWQLPAGWVSNVKRVIPIDEPFDPLTLSGLITSSAAFFGMAAGVTLSQSRGGFSPKGNIWKQIGKLLLGLGGVAVLYFGLSLIAFTEGSVLESIYRYIRYATIGFWVSGIAPALFIRLGLAQIESQERTRLDNDDS